MNVILLEKVPNLGNVGDQLTVKNGYARNFLIPFGKAVAATKANAAAFEARRGELEKAAAEQLKAAEKRGEELAGKSFTLTANASEEGKLFGSIAPRDIAEAITAAGVAVEKREVEMPEGPIHNTGEFQITLRLHSDVAAEVTVVVKAIEA